jgi:predicted ATPase
MAVPRAALWVWMTQEPNGENSVVGVMLPGVDGMLAHMPLVMRSFEMAMKCRNLARRHGAETGQRVWLREYRDFVELDDA